MKSIVDKISKLLAKARDESLPEEEAALFADKVAELLAQHDLTMEDLETPEELTEEHYRTYYCDPWRRAIIRDAARLYFCETYMRKWYCEEARKIRDGMVFVGRPEHIFVAKEMCEYLINTTMRLAIQYSKDHPSEYYSRRKVRLSFERGMGEKLAKRLRDMREARQAPKESSKLPALYDNELAAARAKIDEMNLPSSLRWKFSKLDNAHSAAGIVAAVDVSLLDQVETMRDPGDPE